MLVSVEVDPFPVFDPSLIQLLLVTSAKLGSVGEPQPSRMETARRPNEPSDETRTDFINVRKRTRRLWFGVRV